MAGVLHEAMLQSDVWFELRWEVRRDVVQAGHQQGQEGTGAPAQHWVGQEPHWIGVAAGYFGLLQHPANIETHDGHPGEHRDGAEVTEISQADAERIG